MVKIMKIPRRTGPEFMLMNLEEMKEILEIEEVKETDNWTDRDNLREKEEKGKEKEIERITKDPELEATILAEETTATVNIMTMVFTHMNVLIVTVSGVELVELLFLLSTDLSGMKMKVLRWWNSTRKESDKKEQENADREENAKTVCILLQGKTLSKGPDR